MSLEEAKSLDAQFPTYKDEFAVPTFKSLGIESTKFSKDTNSIYFCGNSLGLLPKATHKAINDELSAWAARGVESHFNHPGLDDGLTSWVDIDLPLLPLISPVVGAKENEVAVMGTLTSNLNSLLTSFYKPKGQKKKILFEKQSFPSDYYAFLNQVKLHDLDESSLLQISPRENEYCLRTEDILKIIDDHHESLALVCFPGIQYYTGQYFDIPTITKKAKQYNIIIGWDLAHAVGNVPLKLHEWDVDFACWCSYKYLNSGPGGIAGIFVNEKYTKDNTTENYPARLAGWWGNNSAERFQMLEKFNPINSALSYRQSNPSVIDVVAVKSSLSIFKAKGGIEQLRIKSIELTRFLQRLLTKSPYYVKVEESFDYRKVGFTIITPLTENDRGSQLSLLFFPLTTADSKDNAMEKINSFLHDNGIIVDERRPNVLRLAPLPLYNSFEEIYYVVKRINEGFEKLF